MIIYYPASATNLVNYKPLALETYERIKSFVLDSIDSNSQEEKSEIKDLNKGAFTSAAKFQYIRSFLYKEREDFIIRIVEREKTESLHFSEDVVVKHYRELRTINYKKVPCLTISLVAAKALINYTNALIDNEALEKEQFDFKPELIVNETPQSSPSTTMDYDSFNSSDQ